MGLTLGPCVGRISRMRSGRKRHGRAEVSLSKVEKMLVAVREELYEGSWDRMLRDLEARMRGRPYVFKLTERIEQDVAAIERLRDYEREFGVDLAEFVSWPGKRRSKS